MSRSVDVLLSEILAAIDLLRQVPRACVSRSSSAGARDVLIHEYFRVDLKMAWDMVRQDLPSLEVQIRRILDDSDRTGVAGF